MKKVAITLLSGALTVAAFSACFMTACTKTNCYSASLEASHKNDVCSTICPGVVGCDGQTYCNVCEANKKGIQYVRYK